MHVSRWMMEVVVVTATTTDGTNCSRSLEILLTRSEIAKISQDDLLVDDLIGDTGNITLKTENWVTEIMSFPLMTLGALSR